MRKLNLVAGVFATALAMSAVAQVADAGVITPSFDNAPTGWVNDRYNPATFADIGSYAGRDNVLDIGISSSDGLTSRPAPYQSTFYNTQGKGYYITGGAGSMLEADLYIPTSWGNEANGDVRTDIWGVMTDGTGVSGYPILGFTNYDGTPRFRAWEDDTGTWVDLSNAINFDNWNTLGILFTGSSYEFFVNGALAYTDTTTDGSTGFQEAIFQGYNFCQDQSLGSVVCQSYDAHWSNTPAPEPASIAYVLGGLSLFGAGAWMRRRKANAA